MIFVYVLAAISPFLEVPILSRILADQWPFRVVGAACAIYALGYGLSREYLPVHYKRAQVWLFLGLTLIAGVSFFTGEIGSDPFQSPLMMYVSYIALLFVILTVVDSEQRVRGVLNAGLAGVVYGAMHIILEYLARPDIRPGYSVGDGNAFSTSAVLFMPFGLLMAFHAEGKRERWLYRGAMGISLLGVTLCASRGGFVALVVASLVLVARSKHAFKNLTIGTIVLLPPLLILPMSPLARLVRPSLNDDTSAEARLIAWKAGLNMITAHPILGVGIGNFKPLMPKYSASDRAFDTQSMAHNTYVELSAELGIPALFVFLAMALTSYRALERVRKRRLRSKGPATYMALGLEAGLVGFLVGIFFFSGEYQKPFWLVIFLSVCITSIKQSRIRPAARTPSRSEDGDVLPVDLGYRSAYCFEPGKWLNPASPDRLS
jgi:O-Antigen ligase